MRTSRASCGWRGVWIMLLRRLLSGSATGWQPEATRALIRERGDRHVDRGLLGKRQQHESNQEHWPPAAVPSSRRGHLSDFLDHARPQRADGPVGKMGGLGGPSLELKVAGPSMLGIGCPDRHALPLTHSPPLSKAHRPRRAASRETGFVLGVGADVSIAFEDVRF